MDKFKQIKKLISELEIDADKFYNKENSAAGTRLRKGMQDIKVMASAARKDVMETKTRNK